MSNTDSIIAPVITSYSKDNGTSGYENNYATNAVTSITFDNSLTLDGTAEADSTVNIFDGTTEIGTAVTNGEGDWSFTTGPLPAGSNSLTAIATDAAGDTSPASPGLVVPIDTMVTITSSGTGGDPMPESIYDDYTNDTWTYVADNDPWNTGILVNGAIFTETLTLDPATFPNGVNFSWSFPMTENGWWNVVAYPNIAYYPHNSTGVWYFTQVANFINLTANYSVRISGDTSNTDVAFDMFLYNKPNGTELDEVMVAVHSPTPGAGLANNEPSITVPGLTDASVAYSTSGQYPLILVSTSADVLSDSISISDIFKTLVWDKILTGQEYIGSIYFGSEVSEGSGDLLVNSLNYTWTSNSNLSGTAGNNTFALNNIGGNNVLGDGNTTVIFSGLYSSYQIETSGSEILITSGQNISTLDVFQGVQFIQFSDGTYNTTTATFISNMGPPTISSVVESPSSGDLDAGKTVTLTLNLSEAVTVAGGTPTLTLNAGGTATYTGGSGTNALTFSYTVGAGQNVASLAATAINLNSAAIADGAGNAATLSLSGLTQTGPQIDTMAPTISSIVESPLSGDLDAGKTVTLTLNLSEAVTVSGGTPTLTLNDGGTATYTGGSGGDALTFSYTVAAGPNVASLAATAVNLNSATVTDGAGNAATLSLSGLTQTGPQIDSTTPTISSVVESSSSGDIDAGKTVTFTLNLSEAVTVVGGTPTLTLNDGGTATYTGGSGTNALTFSYTVSATDSSVAALAVTAVNLNGGPIQDGAGNNANLSLTGLSQIGPQVDTPTAQIDQTYQAVLQHAPTTAEVNASLSIEATFGTGGINAAIIDSPEAQQNVYPVVQIIDLATGSLPTAAQLSSWVPYVESAGLLQGQSQTNQLLDQMAEAFVASTKFGNTYNAGTAVDPNAAITASIAAAIIQAATGVAATQAQIDGWVATGLTIDQVFVEFALGDQYSAHLQSTVQQYLTSLAIEAVSNGALNSTSTITPSDGLNAAQVQGAYQAVLQRGPTAAETNAALSIDGSIGNVAAAAVIVDSPEAQFNVYPIVQIIELATGSLPTAAQLASWVPYVESAGLLQEQSQTNPLLDQMAEAFVASTKFGDTYNGGTAVDPNAPISASIVSDIIQAATGVAATQAQINAWVATGLSIDQVFVDFSLGDQYTAAMQSTEQDYLTAAAINGAGLSTVDGINATGALALGTTATPLTGNDLTVQGGSGSLTAVASGNGDTITELNTSTAGGTITANGNNDIINAANGANTITADGSGDTINLGVVSTGTAINAAQIVHAAGAGDVITFAATAADGTAVTWVGASTVDGGNSSTGIGANSAVHFGNNTGGGSETVVVTGDLTGATTAGGTSTKGIAMVTLGNVVDGHGDLIVFDNATTEVLASTSAVNVTSASSLAQALDMAASAAAASQSGGEIGAETGVIDWFQYGGNTYVLEAINDTGISAPHSALAATDEVIKIIGGVNLGGESLVGHTLTL